MGLIGLVLDFIRDTRNGVPRNRVKADTGAGVNVMSPHFADPGTDAPPLPNDYVAEMKTTQTGGYASVGYSDAKNEGVASPGEHRLYARNSAGDIVCSLYLMNTGAIRAENDNGFIELTAAGELSINGVLFSAHTHDPGTYAAGGDNVTGESGDVT